MQGQNNLTKGSTKNLVRRHIDIEGSPPPEAVVDQTTRSMYLLPERLTGSLRDLRKLLL